MAEISPIKKNILFFIDYKKITKSEFCEKTGISYANLKGKGLQSEMGGQQIGKILSAFSEISPEWLLTGEGPMLRSSDHIPETTKMIPSNDSEGIPLIPTHAIAGVFQGETIVLEYECDRYIVPLFKDAEFLITVKGSSMLPKYNSGDIVACKRVPLDTFFQWNKVYVLDTEQGALIKRVKPGHTNNTITIISDNPNYEPFELPKSKIYHIALVVGVIRLE